jgi:release factor glutamine methyltransferase
VEPFVSQTLLRGWMLDRSSDVGRAMLAVTRRFKEAGLNHNAQLEGAVLMAHVLGVSKSWLYAHPSRPLTEAEITRFEALARRRMCHEPVAYLVGSKPFYGLDITVDPRVLIPRPETELLVERVLEHLKQLVPSKTAYVADVGTGSGAIAVALAVNVPEAIVYATDLSEAALAVAAQNVWRYGVGEQVQVLPGYLLDAVPGPVDVIVANLPYVATPALEHLPPEVRQYEPILALDGGPDGLDIIRRFFDAMTTPAGRSKLGPGGRIYLEIGADQGDRVQALAQAAFPGARVEVQVDYSGLDRLVIVDTGREAYNPSNMPGGGP